MPTFQQLHDELRPKIQRYLSRLVGSDDAEDLTQQVFVRVAQALPNFRGESQPSTWVYRIATNAAIDKLRSAASRHDAQEISLDDSSEAVAKDLWTGEEMPSLEQQAMRNEMYECYEDFLMNLPLNYRTVLALGELEQLPNEEIATILGLTIDTVKIRLHRGRARLLNQLKEHCKAEEWL
jgi:RNA polymerase sigma-70 factor, ECF subfamily